MTPGSQRSPPRKPSSPRRLRSLRRRPRSPRSLKRPKRLRRPRSQKNLRSPRSLRLPLLQPSLLLHHPLCCRRGRSLCRNRRCPRTPCLSNCHRRRYSRSLRHRRIPARRPGPVPMRNPRIHRPRPLRRLTFHRPRAAWRKVRARLLLHHRQPLLQRPRLRLRRYPLRRPNPNSYIFLDLTRAHERWQGAFRPC